VCWLAHRLKQGSIVLPQQLQLGQSLLQVHAVLVHISLVHPLRTLSAAAVSLATDWRASKPQQLIIIG
jgi:hypothetical protein